MRGRLPARVQVRRFYRGVLPSVLLLVAGAIAFLGFLTYRIIHPAAEIEPLNPSHFLLPSVDVAWKAKDNSTIAGWWIP